MDAVGRLGKLLGYDAVDFVRRAFVPLGHKRTVEQGGGKHLQLGHQPLQKLVGHELRPGLYDAQMVGAYFQPLRQLLLGEPHPLAVVLHVLAKYLPDVQSIHV